MAISPEVAQLRSKLSARIRWYGPDDQIAIKLRADLDELLGKSPKEIAKSRVNITAQRARYDAFSDMQKELSIEKKSKSERIAEEKKLKSEQDNDRNIEIQNLKNIQNLEKVKLKESETIMRKWFSINCELSENGEAPISELFNSYTEYCKNQGYKPYDHPSFSSALSRLGVGKRYKGRLFNSYVRRGVVMINTGGNQ